ncbi:MULTISPECIES: hypothetical protein [unclassified Streptosporangium]|uniref:hypothetical protein n=1 Tax=unclassified Streptosporangium TaxID=2632669 RepID=UPI002E2E5FC4|nr:MULTISPECIES: hypothetical protein [unclassified Streptosporangium]
MIGEISARQQPECPSCGRPATVPSSAHYSSEGVVRYSRCACGRWLVVVAGEVIGSGLG